MVMRSMCAPDNILANTDLICCAVLATDSPPDKIVAFLHNIGPAAWHLQDYVLTEMSMCQSPLQNGQIVLTTTGQMLPSRHRHVCVPQGAVLHWLNHLLAL
jgi:hypothetical protein